MVRGVRIAALRQLRRHYSKSSKGQGNPTGKAFSQDPVSTHPSLIKKPDAPPASSSKPTQGNSIEPPGADSLAKSRSSEHASADTSGKQAPLAPPRAAKTPAPVPHVPTAGTEPGAAAGNARSGAPVAPARGTGGQATPSQAPSEPQLLVHKPPGGTAGGPAGGNGEAVGSSGLTRLLPLLGLAALGYGGYFYYQQQQQQQQGSSKSALPNIFLGGGGPEPPKDPPSPGSAAEPSSPSMRDADDTLRKQQESAAKLKQDFEGLQQPEPDKAGNPLHTSNQVPFHEEELALPRQQDEAFSTSGSEPQSSHAEEDTHHHQAAGPSDAHQDTAPEVDPSPVIALLDDIGRDHFVPGQAQQPGESQHQQQSSRGESTEGFQATQKSAHEAAAAARSERQDLEQEQQKQQKLEEQKQKRLEQLKGSTPEAMQIMREAMGDSAGQFMIASHGQDKLHKEEKESTPQPAATQQASSPAAGQLPSDLVEDVSPISLVRHAIGSGEGDVAFQARLKQAEADSALLQELLQKGAASHKEKLEAVQRSVQEEQRRAKGLQSQIDRFAARQREEHNANAARFRQHLAEELRAADSQREAELQRQAHYMTAAAAETAVAERIRHSAALDQVRTKVNALSEAFHRRSDERVTSTTAHKLAAGTFALQEAIGSGRPFEDEVERLAAACEDDHLVIVALTSLSYEHACTGLPTREQLSARWPGVRATAGKLGMLTQGQGGLLSLTLARIASGLKVHESVQQPHSGTDHEPSKDSILAEADQLLSQGQLTGAAVMLQRAVRGTAAELATRDWIQAAEARAVAEQALTVLQAHAATLSASLA